MRTTRFATLLLPLACASRLPATDATGLRVFISADMEGIAGVVSPAQLGTDGFEYDLARRLMTGEVNAAIDGALAAGATAVTVADSHGNGLSLLPTELNRTARLVRSWPRPLEMMEGVEQGFDAAVFVGYHASINTAGAVRAHTISSRRFYDVRLNGRHASEGLLNAAIAGHYGVPVVFVSGDHVAVEEVRGAVDPGIVTAAVKRAIGYHSADSLAPEAARDLIRSGVRRALEQRARVKPLALAKPVRLEIAFKNMIDAEVLALLPVVERVDGATIAFTGKDVIEVVRFLSFATQYDANP
jgi:D-amino peptidase